MFLGVEIGGTKLQLAVGTGGGEPFLAFHRAAVDAPAGAEPLRRQIVEGARIVLAQAGLHASAIAGVGIGFGGPVDTVGGRVVVSNQVEGWRDFPLVDWFRETFAWPSVLHNDADTAAVAEARFGGGRGFDPVLYVTVGSGIGGGLVAGGKIYRGNGAGAVEIGHLRPWTHWLDVPGETTTVEAIASGFGIEQRACQAVAEWVQSGAAESFTSEVPARFETLLGLANSRSQPITTRLIAEAARCADPLSHELLRDATATLGWALAQAATLLNPARIVIGGGVSLMGEDLFLAPVRESFRRYVFPPFAGQAEIVPAALGEPVVLHGALSLARDALG